MNKLSKTLDAAPQKPSAKPFRFGFLVHDVSRMRRTLFDVRMKPLGITRSQWSVLAALSRGGNDGVMQIELARQMDVGKVTIGGLILRLEKIGYVRREGDAKDRRARRVFITEKGFDIIQQMEALPSHGYRRRGSRWCRIRRGFSAIPRVRRRGREPVHRQQCQHPGGNRSRSAADNRGYTRQGQGKHTG